MIPEQQARENVKSIAKTYIGTVLGYNSGLTSEIIKDTKEMYSPQENRPSAGWIHFDKTYSGVVIKDYSLQIGEYVVNYSNEATDNMVLIKNGSLKDIQL